VVAQRLPIRRLPAWSTLLPLGSSRQNPGRSCLFKGRSFSRRTASPRIEAVYGRGFGATLVRAMELITILNRCHRFRGFVYQQAHFSADKKCIEVAVRPRKGSPAVCSRCHLPAPGYDQLAGRRLEFIPIWGFFVFLLYTMRRVEGLRCRRACPDPGSGAPDAGPQVSDAGLSDRYRHHPPAPGRQRTNHRVSSTVSTSQPK
jgi:hypothetical protein